MSYSYPIKPQITIQPQQMQMAPGSPSGVSLPFSYESSAPNSPDTVTTYPYSPGSGCSLSYSPGSSIGNSPSTQRVRATSTDMDELKREIDVHREKGASMRANNLFEATTLGVDEREVKQKQVQESQRPLTARKAAQLRFEEQEKERAEIKARLKKDKETYAKPKARLRVRRGEEQLATSTRNKVSTPDDTELDPESIDGMKYQIQLDREANARAKALKLVAASIQMAEEKKESNVKPRARMRVRHGKEQLATSSRPKALTPDDVLDPESINGMKYQIQLDREADARAKALRLITENLTLID